MPTIDLSDGELADAARGVRGLIKQTREDAQRQENPDMRKLFETSAKKQEQLVEKFEAARKGSGR